MAVATRPLNEILAGQTLTEDELDTVLNEEDVELSDQEVLGFNAFIMLD